MIDLLVEKWRCLAFFLLLHLPNCIFCFLCFFKRNVPFPYFLSMLGFCRTESNQRHCLDHYTNYLQWLMVNRPPSLPNLNILTFPLSRDVSSQKIPFRTSLIWLAGCPKGTTDYLQRLVVNRSPSLTYLCILTSSQRIFHRKKYNFTRLNAHMISRLSQKITKRMTGVNNFFFRTPCL